MGCIITNLRTNAETIFFELSDYKFVFFQQQLNMNMCILSSNTQTLAKTYLLHIVGEHSKAPETTLPHFKICACVSVCVGGGVVSRLCLILMYLRFQWYVFHKLLLRANFHFYIPSQFLFKSPTPQDFRFIYFGWVFNLQFCNCSNISFS